MSRRACSILWDCLFKDSGRNRFLGTWQIFFRYMLLQIIKNDIGLPLFLLFILCFLVRFGLSEVQGLRPSCQSCTVVAAWSADLERLPMTPGRPQDWESFLIAVSREVYIASVMLYRCRYVGMRRKGHHYFRGLSSFSCHHTTSFWYWKKSFCV